MPSRDLRWCEAAAGSPVPLEARGPSGEGPAGTPEGVTSRNRVKAWRRLVSDDLADDRTNCNACEIFRAVRIFFVK